MLKREKELFNHQNENDMRNIIKIAVAVLIMAAAVPMRAQEWTKVNDTTYIRQFIHPTAC